MTNIRDYVSLWEITVEVVKDRGAQRDPDGWEHHAYKVRLHKLGGEVTPEFDWHQGYGIEKSAEDQPAEILDSLVSDAWSYLNAADFEDWAADFGYDTDSRRAEKIYRACGEVAEWLTTFLGGSDELDLVATMDRL